MEPVPTAVRELVRKRVRTMDHVEVLMRLHALGAQTASAAQLIASSGLGHQTVTKALADLVRDELVAESPDGEFRFKPADVDDVATVAALSQLYHQRPVTLVKLVYEQPAAPLSTFADAFRLRDDKK